jgi:hypothetical protein
VESQRFDRTGTRGRIGIVSLASVADHFPGRRDNWIAAANRLGAAGRISAQDAEAVRRVATLGQLIGNTDMHFGNLSFFFSPGGALPHREFEPPLPVAGDLDIWRFVAGVAEAYWEEVASHPLICSEFSALAARNAARIARDKKGIP